ncbi:hypothetical protein MD484_g4640, partial [Candolleomyces efflorescens]
MPKGQNAGCYKDAEISLRRALSNAPLLDFPTSPWHDLTISYYHLSTAISTTTTTNAGAGENRFSLQVTARGPYIQSSPTTLSPMGSPHMLGFHNAPLPEVPFLPSDSLDWRNQGPPPLDYAQSPYGTVPLPPMASGRMELNPMLEHAPAPLINYILTQGPASATLDTRRRIAMSCSFDQPATSPATSSLIIRTSFSTAPVVVQRFGAAITVRDVLTKVYEHLNKCAYEQMHPRPTAGLLDPYRQHDMGSEAHVQHGMVRLLDEIRALTIPHSPLIPTPPTPRSNTDWIQQDHLRLDLLFIVKNGHRQSLVFIASPLAPIFQDPAKIPNAT